MSDTLAPALHLPDWFRSAIALLLFFGFPLALFFAWAYELKPDDLKKEKDVVRSESISIARGHKLDFAIIGSLALALGYFGYDKFVLDPDRDAVEIEAAVQATREQESTQADANNSIKTIAVLAFVNMSDDPGNEYFSDGISEEILNLLASIPDLLVTSRSSAFSFKGQNLDVPTMAARLNVGHVLEGSVRKSGDQLRITAQLIEAASDTHLWSATYDRKLENIFAIQDEIAAAVVDALQITLLGKQPKIVETGAEIYALYLQGRHFVTEGTLDDLERAETLLLQALALDPEYTSALIQLGFVYMRQGTFAYRPLDEGYQMARQKIE